MRTYRWLSLIAAIAITVFETWLFVGSSALPSSLPYTSERARFK